MIRILLTLLLFAVPAYAQEGKAVGPNPPCSAFGSTSGTCLQGNAAAASATTTNQINSVDQTTAYGITTPTPTASSGTFTSVSSSVHQKLIGKTVILTISVVVTTVGTATGNIQIAIPTASLVATACSAVDLSNGSITMVAQVSGFSVAITPTVGVISNNTYLAQCTYEST